MGILKMSWSSPPFLSPPFLFRMPLSFPSLGRLTSISLLLTTLICLLFLLCSLVCWDCLTLLALVSFHIFSCHDQFSPRTFTACRFRCQVNKLDSSHCLPCLVPCPPRTKDTVGTVTSPGSRQETLPAQTFQRCLRKTSPFPLAWQWGGNTA